MLPSKIQGAVALAIPAWATTCNRVPITGRGFSDPLTRCGSSVRARHAQISPTFIEKFQAFHQLVQAFYKSQLVVLSQGFHRGVFTLAVVERLFSVARFNICNSRHIMLGLATKPLASWTRSHNSTSVASGRFWISTRRKLSAACRVRSGPWAGGKAAQLPVSRQRYHHFSNVDLWMPNCAATSAWVFTQLRAPQLLVLVSLGNKVSWLIV